MARAIGEWSWVFNKKLLQGDRNHELHVEGIKGFKVSATHQVCHWRHKRQQYTKPQERRGNTHPRSSRKRQITFATISSFLSSAGRFVPPGLTLVRAACFSVAVAPKQSAKSIVEDCQDVTYQWEFQV
jgi:hypothetical protein